MRIVVGISGRGSNLKALLDAREAGRLSAEIVGVFANRADAGGLAYARAAGLPALVVESRGYTDRAAYDKSLVDALRPLKATGAVLAGFMRIVTPIFLDAFDDGVLNIHPSLLPAFPGVDGVAQAWEWGVKIVGCTVHFVDPEVDHGPIILQRALPVGDARDVEELASRVLVEEHAALVEAVSLWGARRLRIEGRRVLVLPA